MDIWEWAQNLGPYPGAPPATLPRCDTNSPGADSLAREAPLDSPTAAAHRAQSPASTRPAPRLQGVQKQELPTTLHSRSLVCGSMRGGAQGGE